MALKVGLILYSVREEMARDPLATVSRVGELGYKFVETCNHNAIKDPGCGFGIPAPELKAAFDRFGTKIISTHVFPLERADLKAVVAYNKAVGNSRLVNPMGSFSTYDDLMRQCEQFNALGRQLREEGMTFLYHNHQFEYRTFRGKMILDILRENTDLQNMSFELDTFWTMRGGLDPVDVIRRFGRRIALIHQKDFAWDALQPINLIGLTPEEREMRDGETVGMNGSSAYAKNGGRRTASTDADMAEERRRGDSCFTEIGDGIMKIQEIIDAAEACTNAEYIILEQDHARLPSQLESIARSMQGFRKFRNIEWA